MNIIGSETIQSKEKFTVSLAAGVFTVTAHSSVVMPSITGGNEVELFIGGQSFTFNDDTHASSHLTNLCFGITETQHWDQDMPFFIYLVNEDDTPGNVGLFITRNPVLKVTPAAGFIHDKTAAAAGDTEVSIFGAWPDDAGKAAKPCRLMGAIRMRWSTTTDDWTIQTLNTTGDGIGEDKLDKTFATIWIMPDMQNGANTIVNNYLYCVNTPPVWANPDLTMYWYQIQRDGWINLCFSTINSGGCTNGSNAETIYLQLPVSAGYYGIGRADVAVNGNPSALPDENVDVVLNTLVSGIINYIFFRGYTHLIIESNDFSDAADDITGVYFKYQTLWA